MSAADRQPVIIGVGQLRHNRERVADQALEPLDLIERAAQAAAADAGLDASTLGDIDNVGVVQIVSWTYEDPPQAVAERLGASPRQRFVSEVGGHQPVAVLARLADAIAAGESRFALLCGGEAQSSVELLGAVKDPSAAATWSHAPGGIAAFSREVGGTERMWDLGLVGPIRVYPLFENRLRHDLGQSFAESQRWSAEMYARFSEIAADNPAAWNPQTETAAEVAEVGPGNRMICFPYPLRMNALNRVDQAGAVLITNVTEADRLGVAADQRIHIRAAAIDEDCEDVLERPSYGRGPGLERSLDGALDAAQTTAAELDVVDLYSCFPIVPKLASRHLGLDGVDLTATGGLSSFGGPHNNYSTHALVSTVQQLRSDDNGQGMVYANGEYLTKHATVVLGREAGPGPYRTVAPAGTREGVEVDDGYVGEAELETFTVEYDREGARARGYAICRTPDQRRCGVRVSRSDDATLDALVSEASDPIGRTGRVVESDGRRQFTFGAP